MESNLFGIVLVLVLVADIRIFFLFDLGDNSTDDGFNFVVVEASFVIPVSICNVFFFDGVGFVATGVDFDRGGVDAFNATGLGFVSTGAGVAVVATFLGATEVLVFLVPSRRVLFVPVCWLVGSMVVVVNTRGNCPLLLS